MKIKDLGVDIENVERFRKLTYKRSRSFYEKVFTGQEIRYCLSKSDPYPHFAARFAAKEAIAKAMGKSIYQAKKMEIINDQKGKPRTNVKNVLISLSHTKDYAIAFAIWLN